MWPERADWQGGSSFNSLFPFMDIPATRDLSNADYAILGLPFDGSTLLRPGARFGPRAIRAAFSLLDRYSDNPQQRDPPYSQLRVVDYGDAPLVSYHPEETLARTQQAVETLLGADVQPICLGGDHSLSLGCVRACAAKYGPLALVMLDAHPDFWTSPPNLTAYHSNWLRVAVEEGAVDPNRCIHVGFRRSNSMTILDRVLASNITVVTTDDVRRLGVGHALEAIRKVVGESLYISLDIDCVDPAFAPGTGVPEVGGFTSIEILELVRGLKGLPVVGFDVMEVSPAYDHAEITALLAATLVYEYLMSRL
ncbi:MAG: agmatinase [SAR202 cluster bacterium Io17-Chloro-G9]|nr:MAG: agmatinase [SAR202 cluster bacterium Io17-Chloro-G9]